VLLTTVKGQKQVAENTANKEINELINNESAKMNAKKVEIDQWALI